MKMKQKLFSLFLGLVMCLFLVPATPAEAVPANTAVVWVNGVELTQSNPTVECGSGTATYDIADQTLILNNAYITKTHNRHAIQSNADLKIEVIGDVTIVPVGIDDVTGIYAEGEVELVGDENALLVINQVATGIYTEGLTTEVDGEIQIYASVNGIHTGSWYDGTTRIAGNGCMQIQSQDTGIYCPAGYIEIDNKDAVQIKSDYFGMLAGGDITLSGSATVKVMGSVGSIISTHGTVTISGSGEVDIYDMDEGKHAGIKARSVIFSGSGKTKITSRAFGVISEKDVILAASASTQIHGNDNAILLTSQDAKVCLKGTGTVSLQASLEGYKAVYNEISGASPVTGTDLKNYEVKGSPSSDYVAYRWRPIKEYKIWVNGEQFTDQKLTIACGSQGTATLDVTTTPYTLTLDNAYINKTSMISSDCGAIFVEEYEEIRVVLIGENRIDVNQQYGFSALHRKVTFSGTGSLSIVSPRAGLYCYEADFEDDVTVYVTSKEENAITIEYSHWDLKGAKKVCLYAPKGKAVAVPTDHSNDPYSGVSKYHVIGSPDSNYVIYMEKESLTPVTSITVTGVPKPVLGKPCSTAGYDKLINITTEPANAIEKVTFKWGMDDGYGGGAVNETEIFGNRESRGNGCDVRYYLIFDITLKEGYAFSDVYSIYSWPSFQGKATVDGEATSVTIRKESPTMVFYSKRFYAVEPGHYDVWVNGEEFTSANIKSGIQCGTGKATLDVTTSPYTLTLENAQITKAMHEVTYGVNDAMIYAPGNSLKVVLKGKNTISGEGMLFHAKDQTLTITGTGSLNAQGANKDGISIRTSNLVFDNAGDISIVGKVVGYFTTEAIDATFVTFSGSGKVSIKGGYRAIYVVRDVTFSGSGEVELQGKESAITMLWYDACHICLNGTNSRITLSTTDASEKVTNTTVVGTNLDKYKLTGSLTSNRAVYELAIEERLPFTDLTYGTWQYNTAKYVYDRKIILGTSATTFSPNAKMTRAQFIVILWRMAGSPKVEYKTPYTDVPQTHFAATAICWAKSQGLASGYNDGSFKPNDPMTREQFCAFMYRYARYLGKDVSTHGITYTECVDGDQVNKTFATPVQWAYERGFIAATGEIMPKNTITRIQAAAVLQRFLTYYGL